MIAFTVYGEPIPKARPRVIKHSERVVTYTTKRTADWEQGIACAANLAMGNQVPLSGPLAVTLRFYRKDGRRVDIDNLAKSALDSMNGIVYRDDGQVVDLHASKAQDKARPRIEVEVAGFTP